MFACLLQDQAMDLRLTRGPQQHSRSRVCSDCHERGMPQAICQDPRECTDAVLQYQFSQDSRSNTRSKCPSRVSKMPEKQGQTSPYEIVSHEGVLLETHYAAGGHSLPKPLPKQPADTAIHRVAATASSSALRAPRSKRGRPRWL